MRSFCTLRGWAITAAFAAAIVAGAPTAEKPGPIVASAGDQRHSEHRVIVRFAGVPVDGSNKGAAIEGQAHNLRAKPGVIKAQPLPRLGMAVVSLSSAEAGESFMEDLKRDSSVELAVPDTWVTAFDLFGDSSPKDQTSPSSHRSLRAQGTTVPAQCSAHPACRMRGLVGDCCPAGDGMMLSCCSSHGPDLVAFWTYHGSYLSASEDGSISQATGPLQDSGKFEILANDDGSVSFKSHYNKYLVADEQGMVRADRENAQAWEKFQISHHDNGTVSLSSHLGKYLAAEASGLVVANRADASLWEQFHMSQLAAVDQRFPEDPAAPKLWGMHHYAGFDIDAPEAWKIWTGEVGKGITVAVIDTGIDYNHEDLKEQMWVNPLEIPGNGIDDDGNGYVDDIHGADFANEDGDPMDDNVHGTHCAGTIAGIGNNGIGVAGVAWRGVRLMALKFLSGSGSGRTSDAIRAIDYAVAQGAKIASNSWGGGGSSPALRAAIEHASAAGMLFPAAAGNEASNNDEVPSYPANYDVPNVISVAATTWQGEMSSFSCYGKSTVHVAAPGSHIYSSTPGNNYRVLSGTSMATPHVSGLAALIWMYRPQLSMLQVKQIILGSVKKLPSLEGKIITGGLINAKNALEAAWAFDPPLPPSNAPQAIAFADTNPRMGEYSGVVTITAAANEVDVDYYRVYFVSGAGFQLEALGEPIPATGKAELTLTINGTVSASQYARALVAVSGRASGEMPAWVGAGVPHVDLEDYVLPEFGPKSASWSGDLDPRSGVVSGSIFVDRAARETSISAYNVYWRAANNTRGPLVGSIPASGFHEPVCSGPACQLIETSRTSDGGYLYERGAYENYEQATISASGPGRVEFTRFDTEYYYDTVAVGERSFTGNMTEELPIIVEVSEGPLSIQWTSDESETSNGWSFVLHQVGATVELKLQAAELLGSGFEVVPAYGINELPGGAVFVDIIDNATGAPASSSELGGDRRMDAAVDGQGAQTAASNKPRAEQFAVPERAQSADESEPWLHQHAPASQDTVKTLWSERSPEQLSALATRHGRVRASFTIAGLDEKAITKPTVRVALSQAMAAQLPGVQVSALRLVRVSAISKAKTGSSETDAVKFEFEIEPPEVSPAASLDRIEAQLILIGSQGRAAARFDAAITEALAASGAGPQSSSALLHCSFSAPQQLSPKMLIAALPAARAAGDAGSRRLRGGMPTQLV